MKIKKIFTVTFYIFSVAILLTGFVQKMMPHEVPTLSEELNKIILREASKEAGIDFIHKNRVLLNDNMMSAIKGLAPFYTAMSASISVVDINYDSWPDFFVPASEWGTPSHLYINQKNGQFKEDAINYGLSNLPNPTRVGFFDCDNDGKKELLITTFNCPILYKLDLNGKYYQHFNFQDSCTLTTAFNIFDFNHDGLLDITMAPFSRAVPNNWHNADNGPGNVLLFKNIGNCQFKKASEVLSEKENQFTHAIGVGDYRGLDRQDLWAATDFNVDRVFFEQGTQANQKYIKQNLKILERSKAHNGMSTNIIYLYNDQVPSIYISQVFEPGYSTTGNQLWTYDGEAFTDSARDLNINNCGWSWGTNFSDINNDGKEDLLVANGFISGDPNKNYWKKISRFALGSKIFLGNPWNWSTFENTDWSGHQQDCVFVQTDKGFINIAKQINFDEKKLDGRGIASIDFLNNGQVSFLVANQKQELNFYKNESTDTNNWIGFTLVGKHSNRDAIGASVWITLDDGTSLRKALYPFNGYSSQQDSRLHFGLGKNKITLVKIKWPRGLIETFKPEDLNKYYTLIEGENN